MNSFHQKTQESLTNKNGSMSLDVFFPGLNTWALIWQSTVIIQS